jgi:hypothetical protein
MLLRSFIVLLFLFSTSIAQQTVAPKDVSVELKNIQDSYEWFSDISPILVNKTARKIYSFNVGWGVQLLRYNEEMRTWEKGRLGFICGLSNLSAIGESSRPIKPNHEETLWVNSYMAVSRFESPRVFYVEDGEERQLKGKYKLLFQYAYQLWDHPRRQSKPKQTFAVESKEFQLIPR